MAEIDLTKSLRTILTAMLAGLDALEDGGTPTPTPVTISGTPPTSGAVGQSYNFTPTTTNGSGTKSFTLAAGTLLGGLSFSTMTGAISGTPNVAGTMSGIVIRVTDSTGSASTTATNVTIAEAGTPSGQWFANSTDIFANGTDWFADGTRSGGGTTPIQNFSFGPANGAAGEGGSEILVQNFSFGPASNQPGEGSTPIQNFAFGPANGSAGEGADLIQNFSFGAATAQPGEGTALIQNFAFGAATTTPSE